jgi:GR25 family glycosyltransferase involved in LPS biosynthesis
MNTIDHIYYINLDYRTDRRLQFEEWIEESGFPTEKVTRISAVATPGKGIIGCTLSHIKTLEIFLESKNNNCIIFEDDFIPLDIKSFWNNFQLIEDINLDYDIVLARYTI